MLQCVYVLTFALVVGIPFGVQAAEKETQVVTYVAGQAERWQRLNQAFQSKHPSIEVKSIRGNYERTRNRVVTEALAGSHQVDVIHMDPFNGWLLVQRGLFQPYLSKEAAAFPDRFRDPSHLLVCCMQGIPNIISYNTKMVSKELAPKSYDDLLNPRWQDQLGMDEDESEWFAALIAIWGKDKATNFFRALNKQAPSLRRGHTLLAHLNAAGEFAIAVNVFGYEVLNMKNQGAPIEPELAFPVVVRPSYLGVAKHAPHPNAAKLYLDFAISAEGQQLWANFGAPVLRSGVKNKYPELINNPNVRPVTLDMAKDYNQVSKLFYSIIGK
jgi:iron(III) transport system substrate-binding protein